MAVQGAMSAVLLLLLSESVGALQCFKLRIACTDAGQAQFVLGNPDSLACPAGYSTITDKDGCEAAAGILKIDVFADMNIAFGFPFACYYKISTKQIHVPLDQNPCSSAGAGASQNCGTKNANAQMVCNSAPVTQKPIPVTQKPITPASASKSGLFAFGDANTNTCPTDSGFFSIDSETLCRNAATDLGRGFAGVDAVGHYPGGCYTSNQRPYVWFNTAAGAGNPETMKICSGARLSLAAVMESEREMSARE